MTRAPGKRTTDSAITRSLILSAIEAGATYAQAARDAGVSPSRARQVAKEAGLPPRTPGGLRSEAVTTRTARGAAILARVVELAAAAGEDPGDWLEATAAARVRADFDPLNVTFPPGECPRLDPATHPTALEVVERYMAETWPHHADGTPFTRLCRAEHRQGFDCELPAGHDGPHRLRSEAVTTRTARSAELLARLCELAAVASVEPEAWLGDAAWTLAAHARAAAELDHLAAHGSPAERAVAGSVRRLICGAPSNADAVRCIKACEEIVYILEGLPRNDGASPWTCEQLLKLAIGPTDPAQVRADALKETP